MQTMKTLSSIYIKSARAMLGLTQKQFSNKLKIERYNLAKYEAGLSMPSGDLVLLIRKICKK